MRVAPHFRHLRWVQIARWASLTSEYMSLYSCDVVGSEESVEISISKFYRAWISLLLYWLGVGISSGRGPVTWFNAWYDEYYFHKMERVHVSIRNVVRVLQLQGFRSQVSEVNSFSYEFRNISYPDDGYDEWRSVLTRHPRYKPCSLLRLYLPVSPKLYCKKLPKYSVPTSAIFLKRWSAHVS